MQAYSPPAWHRFISLLLAHAVLWQALYPAAALALEGGRPLPSRLGSAAEKLIQDAGLEKGSFEGALPEPPAPPEGREIAVLSRKDEPDSWSLHARWAREARQDLLARVLGRAGVLERKGIQAEHVEALRKAAQGLAYAELKALVEAWGPVRAARLGRLLLFLSRGDAAVGAWLRSHLGEAPADVSMALPSLAALLSIPDDAERLKADARRALHEASAKRPPTADGVARKKRNSRSVPSPEKEALEKASLERRYEQAKLSQQRDLVNGASKGEPGTIERLKKFYEGLLPAPPANGGFGMSESAESRAAALQALLKAWNGAALRNSPPEAASQDKAPLAGTPQEKAILESVSRIESLKVQLQDAIALRETAAAAVAATESARNAALKLRRGGQDMLEFRKNHARLAMVTELSYANNVLTAAQKAVGGMLAIVDRRMAQIEEARGRGQANAAATRARQAKKGDWQQKVDEDVAEDNRQAGLFTTLQELGQIYVDRVEGFKLDVGNLIAEINGKDKGSSADAPSEYRRRKAMVPELERCAREDCGDGSGDISNLSVASLKKQLEEVDGYIAQIAQERGQFRDLPIQGAAQLIVFVPPIPEVKGHNFGADPAAVLPILRQRRQELDKRLADLTKMWSTARDMADPGYGGSRQNEFGDSIPASLSKYRESEAQKLNANRSKMNKFAALIDQTAAKLGGGLPLLSGKSAEELREDLKNYPNQLQSLRFEDSLEGNKLMLEMLNIARYLPLLADATIRTAEAEGTIKVVDEAIPVVQKAAAGLKLAVDGVQGLLDDVAEDETYIRNFSNDPGKQQALINRKKDLVERLDIMLRQLKELLEKTLLPFQEKRAGSGGASMEGGDNYNTLYTIKLEVYELIEHFHKVGVPWLLASVGAPENNQGQARANIAGFRRKLDEYKLNIAELQRQVKCRKDPECQDPDEAYGEAMPYSLPRRIKKYEEEMRLRAAQVNRQASAINEILADIDRETNGRSGLQPYALPADVNPEDPGAAERLKQFGTSGAVDGLVERLKQIAAAAEQGGGDGLKMPSLDASGIPTGTQPSPTVNAQQKTALLALEAVKRLAPSTAAPDGDSFADALKRFVWAASVKAASEDALANQVPRYDELLKRGDEILGEMYADLEEDARYISAPESGGLQLMARKIDLYGRLRDFSKHAVEVFQQKAADDRKGADTIKDVDTYLTLEGSIYEQSGAILDAEYQAAKLYADTLGNMKRQLDDQADQVRNWLSQLNPAQETALNRLSQSMSRLMERTKAVLETNGPYYSALDLFKKADRDLIDLTEQMGLAEKELKKALVDEKTASRYRREDMGDDLADKVEALTMAGTAWFAEGKGILPQAMIIPKSHFEEFLDSVLSSLGGQNAARRLAQSGGDLPGPMMLSQLIPNSKVLSLGDPGTGFYVAYQSNFSVPNGLESDSQVTLGNVASANLFGAEQNLSLIGYRFASPPNSGNAPYGDRGISVQLESLGKNGANYLDITFHRLLQDIPKDNGFKAQTEDNRLMVFENFALMVSSGRLYLGGAGFGDFATSDLGHVDPRSLWRTMRRGSDGSQQKPYYFGGALQQSIRFNELMELTAEQSALWAKDPRRFLQTINLDFTQYDPLFDQDFVISARGDSKYFNRQKFGARFNLGRFLGRGSKAPSFTLELYGSRLDGSDDIGQWAGGATVLSGMSFDAGPGSPFMPVSVNASLTAEAGQKYETGKAFLNIQFQKGIAFSAQGKIMPTHEQLLAGDLRDAPANLIAQASMKLNPQTDIFVSYGSPYLGLNPRFTLGSHFMTSVGDVWRTVFERTKRRMSGDLPLERFNKNLDEFFRRDGGPQNPLVRQLEQVYANDIGKKLLSLDMGQFSKDLEDLVNQGAFFDNTRMHGTVGFVPWGVGTTLADRVAGPGFQTGTMTQFVMKKTKRVEIERKVVSIFSAGLALQARLIELTKEWEQAVADILQAQWELQLAQFAYNTAQEDTMRLDAEGKALEAQIRLKQATLRYNLLTGQRPETPFPFEQLNANDYEQMLARLRELLGSTARLSSIMRSLDADKLRRPDAADLSALDKFSSRFINAIPFIEQITFGFGQQLYDNLSNQVIGGGLSVRLPLYDSDSRLKEEAWTLKNRATIDQMRSAFAEYRLRAAQERMAAEGFDGAAERLREEMRPAADAFQRQIAAYRNGLCRREQLWQAYRRWHWTITRLLETRSKTGLKAAWAMLEGGQAAAWRGLESRLHRPGKERDMGAVPNAATAFDHVTEDGRFDEFTFRAEAARRLSLASSRRLVKLAVDLSVFSNFTAEGLAWLPAVGATALGFFPILGVDVRPQELADLQKAQHGDEAEMFGHLKSQAKGEASLLFFENYSSYRATEEILKIYRDDLLPAKRAAASRRPGDDAAQVELAQAEAQQAALAAQHAQTRAALNALLGRPLDSAFDMAQNPREVLGELERRLKAAPPLESRREVLKRRLEVARSVETIVDKNLKLEHMRAEPVSLVARAVGRLISAISGGGDAKPEAVSRARQQTLQAERALRSFEKGLPAADAKLRFELKLASDALCAIRYRRDSESRVQALALQHRIRSAQAQLAALGRSVDETAADTPCGVQTDLSPAGRSSERLPRSLREMENRLVTACESETVTPGPDGLGSDGPLYPAESGAQSYSRLNWVHQSLDMKPVAGDCWNCGQSFLENWVELRLRLPQMGPPNLASLGRLQEERGDQLHRAQMAAARARARGLLTRFKAAVELYRWAERSAHEGAPLFKEQMESAMRRDFAEIAAHLGLSGEIGFEQAMPLVPQYSTEPSQIAEQMIRDLETIDQEAVRRILFEDGVPLESLRTQQEISQLKADRVAKSMSYKGFTLAAAFGFFRGQRVGGLFVEAPDMNQVQRRLEEILLDGVRQEYEGRQRVKQLAFQLHALMASVAEKTRLLESRRSRLEAARRNLRGTWVELGRGMAPPSAVAAAQAELERAWKEFIETLTRLRMEFVQLVSELQALGERPTGVASKGGQWSALRELPGAEDGPRARMLRYWSERMLDPGFEARLRPLLEGAVAVPAEDRRRLSKLVQDARELKEDVDVIRHSSESPAAKLDLLTKADLEGRRQKIEAALDRILSGLEAPSGQGPSAAAQSAQALHKFLSEDLRQQASAADGEVLGQRRVEYAMRDAYWNAVKAPPSFQKIYLRLSGLSESLDDLRGAFLGSYMEHRERPEDFMLRDARLDEYLKAQLAYDEAVIRAFQNPNLRRSKRFAQALGSLFSLQESLERQRDFKRYGRGLLAIDALIAAEKARLDGMRFNRAGPLEFGPVAQRIAWLEDLRRRWMERPGELEGVAAARDARGRVAEWIPIRELDGLKKAGRLIAAAGSRWVLGPAQAGLAHSTTEQLRGGGALELEEGPDAAVARAESERLERWRQRLGQWKAQALAGAEFVALPYDLDGEPSETQLERLSLEELRRRERQGLVLYFDAQKDRRGLHPALHPFQAMRMNPRDLRIYLSTAPIFGRFGTLEALRENWGRGGLRVLEMGAMGAKALASEAARRRDLSMALGWVELKLEGYGFALDPDGLVAGVYMDKKEYREAQAPAAASKGSGRKFHLSKDLHWGLDSQNRLVSVRLKGKALWETEGRPRRWVKGEVEGVEIAQDVRLVRVFGDVTGPSRKWEMEDMEGRRYAPNARKIPPNFRLKRYIDPETGLPVLLGRRVLEAYVQAADRHSGGIRRWPFVNLPDLVAQIPRSIFHDLTFRSSITGIDARQDSYLGRVYAHRLEGSAGDDNALLKLVRFLDILDLLPDPVEGYRDPSQFPDEIELDDKPLAGEPIYALDPDAKGKDITWGLAGLLRQRGYAREDIEAARGRILAAFQGGVQSVLLHTVLGRNRPYIEAQSRVEAGEEAIDAALEELGLEGADGRALLQVDPKSIQVDHVSADVQIFMGAREYEAQRRRYELYAEELAKKK